MPALLRSAAAPMLALAGGFRSARGRGREEAAAMGLFKMGSIAGYILFNGGERGDSVAQWDGISG